MQNNFSIVKKGYNTIEVDEYIEELEKVIRSYKEKDKAIKNAIINAQVAADNIVKNAELEAASIKHNAVAHLANIQNSLVQQKVMLKEFQADYNTLISKYVIDFNDAEYLQTYTKINELEEYLVSLHAPAPVVAPAPVAESKPRPEILNEDSETQEELTEKELKIKQLEAVSSGNLEHTKVVPTIKDEL